MKVSIVIPSYNGEQRLPTLLDALAAQTYRDFEVIVILDGSTDSSETLLRNRITDFPALSFFRQDNRGRASTRNAGAAQAKGDLLIFFDDDMIPEKNCVSVHVEHHTQIAGSILTGAQIDPGDERRSDFQRYKAHLSRKWSIPLEKFKGRPLDRSHIFITAANFSVSTEVFRKVGGFDERLRDVEDFELAMRAFEAGISLYYNSAAFAWHDDRVTAVSYIRRQREYARAYEELRKLKPELCSKFPPRNTYRPQGLKKLIYRLFSGSRWVQRIDKSPAIHLLPATLRYKLYTTIVAANGLFFPDGDL